MSEPRWFMKAPCASCPFREDVRPFLRAERAADLAYATQNPYAEFHCHKTLGHDDEEGDTCLVETSLVCAGFLSMQINESSIEAPKGFEPSPLVYCDSFDMVQAYEDAEAEGRI